MHQHPRPPPVTASPANSERTNPTRTNNSRDHGVAQPVENWSRHVHGTGPGDDVRPTQDQSRASAAGDVSRLNQVIQNFHTKAALIILHSRVDLTPAFTKSSNKKRVNKWFNVELDETEDYDEAIRCWRSCDLEFNRPPPLVIEIFLNKEELTSNQRLIILDDQGKRWDVMDALASSSDNAHAGRERGRSGNEVILERWTIHLGGSGSRLPPDLTNILPLVYKKSIVLFRSLFTYTKFLPTWKFSRRFAKIRSNSHLKLKYRIVNGSDPDHFSPSTNLTAPLCGGESKERTLLDFSFGSTDSPAGPFSVHVLYRTNCEFRVDDSEAILSSRFLGADDEFFKPSLPSEEVNAAARNAGVQEVGSLPLSRRHLTDNADPGQAYGSLSTFHQVGPTGGMSPISALRNANISASPPPSPPVRVPLVQRSSQKSRPSLGQEGSSGPGRRSSTSFHPFKAPSLSASPSVATPLTSSPRPSLGRVPVLGSLNEARGIPPPNAPANVAPKLTAGPPDNVVTPSASTSAKPAPMNRYSSSFSHRRAKLSSGGSTKTDDDQNSSGKGSAASSTAQPGSGLMVEGGRGSSSSVHEDDENITDFLKLLEMKKDLLAPSDSVSAEASTRRTTAALTRFHRMRDSNAALSDSMSSSLLLQRSSSSSSRQLSSVPAMIAANSVSSSSSPGKPISPHTPHTPAIPSRLSANSIIEYNHPNPRDRHHGHLREERDSPPEEVPNEEIASDPSANNPSAIDIPTSPRPFLPNYRRSSSVAQRRPLTEDEDIADLYGMRSASMGAEDSQARNRGPSDGRQGAGETEGAGGGRGSGEGNLTSDRQDVSERRQSLGRRAFNSRLTSADGGASGSASATSSTHQVYRSRLTRGGAGRGAASPHGSLSSYGGGTGTSVDREHESGSGSLEHRGGRHSFSRPENKYVDDDEPLLFALSELGASRRSLEEPRGQP